MSKLGPKHKYLFMMTHVTCCFNKRCISCSINTLCLWLHLSLNIWVICRRDHIWSQMRHSKWKSWIQSRAKLLAWRRGERQGGQNCEEAKVTLSFKQPVTQRGWKRQQKNILLGLGEAWFHFGGENFYNLIQIRRQWHSSCTTWRKGWNLPRDEVKNKDRVKWSR